MHLPRQAVFDRSHDQTGAAENDLPLGPLVQLRLALPDAEHAFQQGPLLLVGVHRALWKRRTGPRRGQGRFTDTDLAHKVSPPLINKRN